jgi:hypothetical protein
MPDGDISREGGSIMSKLRYIGGFTGPGRHRLEVQHDGAWDQMRILFKRHSDGTTDATATVELGAPDQLESPAA